MFAPLVPIRRDLDRFALTIYDATTLELAQRRELPNARAVLR